MTLWAKSVRIFNAIREHGKPSIRRLAERTGLSKSSVHRQLQAAGHRDRYPESGLWETPEGRDWLIRLVVPLLYSRSTRSWGATVSGFSAAFTCSHGVSPSA